MNRNMNMIQSVIFISLCHITFSNPVSSNLFPQIMRFVESASENGSLLNVLRFRNGSLLSNLVRDRTTTPTPEFLKVQPLQTHQGVVMTQTVNNPRYDKHEDEKTEITMSTVTPSPPNWPVINWRQLLNFRWPTIQDLKIDQPMFGRIASATAVSALALGAFFASPASTILRRGDVQKKIDIRDEKSWLDSLKFWENGSTSKKKRKKASSKKEYFYLEYNNDPYYEPGSKTKKNNDYIDDSYIYDYVTDDNPKRKLPLDSSDLFNVKDSYSIGGNSPLSQQDYGFVDPLRERRKNRNKKQPTRRNDLQTDLDSSQTYLTVEEVNRIADDSLSDIMSHYQKVIDKRKRNQPSSGSYVVNRGSNDYLSESSPNFEITSDIEGYRPYVTDQESDWYPIEDPALLKNHKITSEDLEYLNSDRFRHRTSS